MKPLNHTALLRHLCTLISYILSAKGERKKTHRANTALPPAVRLGKAAYSREIPYEEAIAEISGRIQMIEDGSHVLIVSELL